MIFPMVFPAAWTFKLQRNHRVSPVGAVPRYLIISAVVLSICRRPLVPQPVSSTCVFILIRATNWRCVMVRASAIDVHTSVRM